MTVVFKECHKIQGTVKLIKEDIAVKLQQIELQIVDFESITRYNIQCELSEQLEKYSGKISFCRCSFYCHICLLITMLYTLK